MCLSREFYAVKVQFGFKNHFLLEHFTFFGDHIQKLNHLQCSSLIKGRIQESSQVSLTIFQGKFFLDLNQFVMQSTRVLHT